MAEDGMKIRVHGCRGSQIGDAVGALCCYAYLRHLHPDAHTIWQVARKHLHAAPLFYENPLISQLVISDAEEGYGPMDIALAETCSIHFPLMPEHPEPHIPWPCVRNFYQETFVMSGLTMEQWNAVPEDILRPRLHPWFIIKRYPKTIAYWPCAAYGQTQIRRSRNASRPWAVSLVARLAAEGYNVVQFGHPKDYADCGGALGCPDVRGLTFMEQIIASLGCDLVIGTDSGAGIAIGAYGHSQLTLLTDHFPGHTTNHLAFQPWNPNNRSFVGLGSADNINVDEVVGVVHDIVKT